MGVYIDSSSFQMGANIISCLAEPFPRLARTNHISTETSCCLMPNLSQRHSVKTCQQRKLYPWTQIPHIRYRLSVCRYPISSPPSPIGLNKARSNESTSNMSLLFWTTVLPNSPTRQGTGREQSFAPGCGWICDYLPVPGGSVTFGFTREKIQHLSNAGLQILGYILDMSGSASLLPSREGSMQAHESRNVLCWPKERCLNLFDYGQNALLNLFSKSPYSVPGYELRSQ